MTPKSKEHQRAIASGANAINFARPVRSAQSHSLEQKFKTFTYDDRHRDSVPGPLSQLMPATTPNSATIGQKVATIDIGEVEGPRGSPLTPVASPQVPLVEEDATAGAEASPTKQNLQQQHSAIGRKRKANDAVPVTPPRRLRQKIDTIVTTPTSDADAPAPDLLANLSRNVKHFIPSNLPDYEHDPITYGMSLDPFNHSFKLATSDKDKAEEIIDKILAVSSRLLKRQRVLVHDYDSFDSQTYKPIGHVDVSTKALRHFTDTVRTGLEDMERCMGELADL